MLLTNTCTQSLELAALILKIQDGDEVIMPSFTHTSTANAFVLRGAKPVFVDVRPDTMNIDETLIEQAITGKTKCIVPMHYGGVGCEMEAIQAIAKKNSLKIVEDAAHGANALYKGKYLGQLGDIGCISYNYIKNINCGEGGVFILNDRMLMDELEIIYEHGTDKAAFDRGNVSRFVWKAIGSKFYPSELMAAFLYCQLQEAQSITEMRLKNWNHYYDRLSGLERTGVLELPRIPQYCKHNGHVFFVKADDKTQRERLSGFLNKKGVEAAFHYIPLHSTKFGLKTGRFSGEDKFTTRESERLLRLPLFHNITQEQIDYVVDCLHEFYR